MQTSIIETIRQYQRRIDRSVQNEAMLMHCLHKLNKLHINVKCLQETKVGRTVNNLRKHDGDVGRAAEALVAKWKKEVEAAMSESSVSDSTDNNKISKFCSSEKLQEKSSQSDRGYSKNRHGMRFKAHRSSSSVSKSSDTQENASTMSREKRKTMKCDSDLINIDSTTGTSFAEALEMLDMPSKTRTTHKAKKLLNETPILLTKRPILEPLLDIAHELIFPSTNRNTESMKPECALQNSRKQTTRMTNEETISNSITSRTVKPKVFSGNQSELKVATLFEMCIHILQDNIDLLEFIGGVPFDILRPVLERTTCEQLITLEDYNPYLMEDTHCLWEQHCKRRFRSKRREELETWREMYIRCLEEEQIKFNSLTATIKLSKERQKKPIYVSTVITPPNTKLNGGKSLSVRVAVGDSKIKNAPKSKDSVQSKKRLKKWNDDPDWTPTTWYKTLYKKPQQPKPLKPPKPPMKKTIDILRYERAKALEKDKEKWKKRPR